MVAAKIAFKLLTGKPTGKISSERPRHGWEDNIRMDLKEISVNTRNWNDSAQDRDYCRALVNATLKLWILYSVVDVPGNMDCGH